MGYTQPRSGKRSKMGKIQKIYTRVFKEEAVTSRKLRLPEIWASVIAPSISGKKNWQRRERKHFQGVGIKRNCKKIVGSNENPSRD
jgi:hypothetical protein